MCVRESILFSRTRPTIFSFRRGTHRERESELYLSVLNSFSHGIISSDREIAFALSRSLLIFIIHQRAVTALKKRHFRPTRNTRVELRESEARKGGYLVGCTSAWQNNLFPLCPRKERRSFAGERKKEWQFWKDVNCQRNPFQNCCCCHVHIGQCQQRRRHSLLMRARVRETDTHREREEHNFSSFSLARASPTTQRARASFII